MMQTRHAPTLAVYVLAMCVAYVHIQLYKFLMDNAHALKFFQQVKIFTLQAVFEFPVAHRI